MDTIKDHNTTRNDPTDEPNHALIVPPLNFSMIMPGIYRSGFPSVKNHQFLLELGLKSIIYVSDSKCLDYHTTFCQDNNIEFTHYKVKLNNEPFKEMEQAAVCKIITKMLDTRNHPILVHCDRGVRRTGCIVGCLRRIQSWSMTAIFDEFQRFSGNKIRMGDQEFIEVFDQTVRVNPLYKPKWLN